MTIEYLSLFVLWVDSFVSLLLHHEIIISYPNDKMDKRVFNNWVLIFLIAWGIFFGSWELDLEFLPSSLFLLWVELLFLCALFPESTEGNHFLSAHIPWMNESHVFTTTSAFSTSSSTNTSCSLIWETLVKYDCMVSRFWIFTFFNYFLKVIFRFMFFPSNSLFKESNISFGVFREDTCGINWSLIESAMIFLASTKFFLCKAF